MSTMPATDALAASTARDARRARLQRFPAQVLDLLLIELTNWRWSWRSLLLSATLAPLLSIVALGVFARDSGAEALSYVLTGNMVLSLLFGNLRNVENHIMFMRFRGALDYFATLPVQRHALLVALITAFLLLSLPALLLTVLVGALYLRVPIAPSPLLVLVVPLCAASLAGLGALIAASCRSPEEASALSFIATLGMTALGPVLIPPDRLPAAMLAVGYLSPATYAASALRQALLGPVTLRIVVDMAVLAGLAAGLLAVVARRIDWRRG